MGIASTKKWTSPVVRGFWKSVGGRGPVDAIVRVCNDLRKRAGRDAPPFQQVGKENFEFAKVLNIRVMKNDIKCDGMLTVIDDRFVIQVRESANSGRQNFTVCHEIGHCEMLRRADAIDRGHAACNVLSGSAIAEEERLADVFATNLLMPRSIFCSYAQDSLPSLASMQFLSKKFGTSLTATAIRLAEFALWPFVAVWWVPEHYVNDRLGLRILRTTNPTPVKNPFSGIETIVVNSDIVHRAIDGNCETIGRLRHRQWDGEIRRWILQSMPLRIGVEQGVFTLLVLDD